VIPHVAGQYATFELKIEGKTYVRTWTISSAPLGANWLITITVKRKKGGVVSNWLYKNMQQGMTITLKGIDGTFVLKDTKPDISSPKLLMVAGGVGITPIMSIVRYLALQKLDWDVVVFHSISTLKDRVFLPEFQTIHSELPNIKFFVTITQGGTSEGGSLSGRVTKDMISQLAPDVKERTVYLCGPEPFMEAVENILSSLDVPPLQVITEKFNF